MQVKNCYDCDLGRGDFDEGHENDYYKSPPKPSKKNDITFVIGQNEIKEKKKENFIEIQEFKPIEKIGEKIYMDGKEYFILIPTFLPAREFRAVKKELRKKDINIENNIHLTRIYAI